MPILSPGQAGGHGIGGSVTVMMRTDFSQIHQSFRSLTGKLENLRVPLKKSAVDYMSKSVIKDRFEAEGIPKWKEHSLYTIARHGSHKILYRTGRLMRSATAGSSEFSIHYTKDTATFGSSVDYAPMHDQPRGTFQTGGGGTMIPGRPWSYVTQKNADEMRDILLDWTTKQLRISGFKR